MWPLHRTHAQHRQHQHALPEQEEPAEFPKQERQLAQQGVASVTVLSKNIYSVFIRPAHLQAHVSQRGLQLIADFDKIDGKPYE